MGSLDGDVGNRSIGLWGFHAKDESDHVVIQTNNSMVASLPLLTVSDRRGGA